VRAIFLVKSLVKTTLPAIAAQAEERKMVATLVREFLLNDAISLEKIALLAASLDRIKAGAKIGLTLSCALAQGYTGRLRDEVNTICLRTLHKSWHAIQESGVVEHLGDDLSTFIHERCVAALGPEAREGEGAACEEVGRGSKDEVEKSDRTAIQSAAIVSYVQLCTSSEGLLRTVRSGLLDLLIASCESSEDCDCPLVIQSRMALLLVLNRLMVEGLQRPDITGGEDAEVIIVELRAMWARLSEAVQKWAQAALEACSAKTEHHSSAWSRDSLRESVSFGFGALDTILPVVYERSEKFDAEISATSDLLLRLMVGSLRHDASVGNVVSHLTQQAAALLSALLGAASPTLCDQIAASFMQSDGFDAELALAGEPEAGLSFLCCLTSAALTHPSPSLSEHSSDFTSCVANIIRSLASSLDEEGRDWWAPALGAFVSKNCSSPLLVGGEAVALKVLGGSLTSPSLGMEIEVKDGHTGVLIYDESDTSKVDSPCTSRQNLHTEAAGARPAEGGFGAGGGFGGFGARPAGEGFGAGRAPPGFGFGAAAAVAPFGGINMGGFGQPNPAPAFGAAAGGFGQPNPMSAASASAAVASTEEKKKTLKVSPHKVWVSLPDGSVLQSEATNLAFKSPYVGALGPKTLQLLLPYIHANKPTLFSVDDADDESQEVTSRASRMKTELRHLKALVEHVSCYDGFGEESVGEFSTIGEAEIATVLHETAFNGRTILSSVLDLALEAGQYDRVSWAVRALEECVTALEHHASAQLSNVPVSAVNLRMLRAAGGDGSFEKDGHRRDEDGRGPGAVLVVGSRVELAPNYAAFSDASSGPLKPGTAVTTAHAMWMRR